MKKLRKILLVDDDQLTSNLNKELLEEMEIAEEVLAFTSQWEALSYIVEILSKNYLAVGSAFDLVFLDMKVADIMYFEFLMDLEAFRINMEKLRIVILGEHSDLERTIKLSNYESRISAYLSQPLHK
ncbi:CheY-like receiver domain-containing protein [Flammeovirgaceae bacterium 311]|nr:CheY-like receiver domain-containing protein [Flammeovirgaceae bacterium 311]